jgi:hypothetical protein
MNLSKTSSGSQEQSCLSRSEHFMNRFHLGSFLRQSGIHKTKGIPAISVLKILFILPFVQKSFYRQLINQDTKVCGFGKDVIYDFLKNPRYNWRTLLFGFSTTIIQTFFNPLTDQTSRERVLIIDESTVERLRSKSVELLARVYDHIEHSFIRGFRLLVIGWSDGVSFLPLDHALLSSAQKSNRYQGITKDIDKRTCGYKRRLEAMKKSTDLLVPMVKRALTKIQADYILMDSWFGFPVVINALADHLHVICRVKKMSTIRYNYRGKSFDLSELYSAITKRRGRARIKASVVVTQNTNRRVKVVFLRNDNKNDTWIALLSTDLSISDHEIVRLYGKRWDIELFFKMCKQHLRLTKEVQLRDFDGMTAHTTIVMLRYIFLAVEQRETIDERTIGELFYQCCEEIADITFIDALKRILIVALEKIRYVYTWSEDMMAQIIHSVMGTALECTCLCGGTISES